VRQNSDGSYDALYSAINQKSFLRLKTPTGSLDLDVVVVDLLAKGDNLPFLQLSPKKKPGILNRILMTGYPGGASTFNMGGNILNLRLSQIVQSGEITALIPTDSAPTPQLIQTDIISTGGSSGSPIIDITDYKVLGIAQQVIGGKLEAGVEYDDTLYLLKKDVDRDKTKSDDGIKNNYELIETETKKRATVFGKVGVGAVIALSNNMLRGLPKLVSEMKKGNTNVTNLEMNFTTLSEFTFLAPNSEDLG